MDLNDLLIGRDGGSLNGTVHDKSFVLESGFGEIEIPKKKISQIHFMNPPQFPKDVIILKDGGKQVGTITAKTIDFTPDAGSRMKIKTSAIHTIFMMGAFDEDAFGLPAIGD